MLARALRRLMLVVISLPLLWQPGTTQPAGDPDAYAFLSRRSGHDLVARWKPCETINYRVNLAHAPGGSLPEVKIAVARLAEATGLSFHYAGETSVVPGADPGNYPPGTHLVIAWAAGGQDTGIGGATYIPGHTSSGEAALIINRGVVLLDATAAAGMPRGFGSASEATTGQLLMHELGHAVGLAHPLIDDPHEIMYSQLTGKAATWGAGDLAGLRAVGAAGGCAALTAPAA